MRIIKTLLILLLAGSIVFLSVSCTGSATATATPKPQIVTVQKGTISLAVTGTGNLALENKQLLSFGQTGLVNNASNAKISDVLVKEGDVVEQGQILAKADTKDWQDQLVSDQHNLDSMKAGLDSAKSAMDTAKSNVIQATAGVQTAKYNLQMQSDVKAIQDHIDEAKAQLAQAKLNYNQALSQNSGQTGYWNDMIYYYTIDTQPKSAPAHTLDGGIIGVLTKQINNLIADPAHSNSASSVADITAKQLAVQQAEANLVNSQNGITTAQNNIVLAQNRLDEAQKTLDEDKTSPQEIVAPYKGLITKVNVAKGDIVRRDATLIEIAEPDKFVANILVTERDIMSVKLGGDASVSFDALTGLNFPAKITQIAPLATVQQGVVNYKVTVELTSVKPTFPSRSAASGSRPAGTPGSTASVTPPAGTGTTGSGGTGNETRSGLPGSFAASAINLKDGLSATVNIPIQQKENVLVVPSRAISRQGQTSTVQVVSGATTESRTVKTGLSDASNTEITEGLKEGDQISIVTTSSTRTNFGGPAGGGLIIR
jgi:multidrug efflux pump subunit AcrA (membrane-fusion protein)